MDRAQRARDGHVPTLQRRAPRDEPRRGRRALHPGPRGRRPRSAPGSGRERRRSPHVVAPPRGRGRLGVAAPAARLHIVGNGESVRLQGATPSITFVPNGPGPGLGYARVLNHTLALGTSDVSDVLLTPNGLTAVVANGTTGFVGIGEANNSPASLRVLQKQGGILLTNNANGNAWEFSASPANASLELYNGQFAGVPVGVFGPNGVYLPMSDRRLKRDITNISNGTLSKIMQLEPVTYRFKAEDNNATLSVGFIAQNVQELFPELVGGMKDKTTGQDYLNVNYTGISVMGIKAIQEQQTQIEPLKKENEQLRKQYETLEARLLKLENK